MPPQCPKNEILEPKLFCFCTKYMSHVFFCKKTALNLVKYGLHSPTYYLHPHKGGSHSVLYFTIEKYSNSNVLHDGMTQQDDYWYFNANLGAKTGQLRAR